MVLTQSCLIHRMIVLSRRRGRGKPRHIAWFISDVTGEFYFRIKADNHETIAGSEGYRNKDDMFDTLDEYFDNWDVVEDEV